jgi:hypothetical protein
VTYAYRRGPGSGKRVMHIALHDPLTGQPTTRTLCERGGLRLNTTINVPLGRPICKWCLRVWGRRGR